jgi:hypothetical protein
LLVSGCSTLSVSAKKTADCKFKVTAPHEIRCTVDGTETYTQTGPMSLDVKNCCKCEE